MQRDVDIAAVKDAAARIAGHVVETPCLRSDTLSGLLGVEVFLKFENLQFTASFKERGALNRLLALDAEQRRRGVITVSAGNHAQGVAYHARRLGIPATIVMPHGTPTVKVRRVREFGGEVIFHGEDFSAAWAIVPELANGRGLTLVHPFEDPWVIAGQGTVAIEMLRQVPDLDIVVVPIGGGGLISGIAIVAAALAPSLAVLGVQCQAYPAMAAAVGRWNGGVRRGSTIAEGIAVGEPGEMTRAIVGRLVADVLVVGEEEIERAVALLLEIEKTLCEGAGAAGLAALLAFPERFRGRRVGVVLSGGNIDTRLLIAILQRHLVRVGRLIRFRVTAPDAPGVLATISRTIESHGGNINDVHHERAFGIGNSKAVSMLFDVELRDPAEKGGLVDALSGCGFAVDQIL